MPILKDEKRPSTRMEEYEAITNVLNAMDCIPNDCRSMNFTAYYNELETRRVELINSDL
jgi:hypothetical protein